MPSEPDVAATTAPVAPGDAVTVTPTRLSPFAEATVTVSGCMVVALAVTSVTSSTVTVAVAVAGPKPTFVAETAYAPATSTARAE